MDAKSSNNHECILCGNISSSVHNIRKLKAIIEYHKKEQFPLTIRTAKGFCHELPDCESVQAYFNFKPGFKGKKKVTIYFKNGW